MKHLRWLLLLVLLLPQIQVEAAPNLNLPYTAVKEIPLTTWQTPLGPETDYTVMTLTFNEDGSVLVRSSGREMLLGSILPGASVKVTQSDKIVTQSFNGVAGHVNVLYDFAYYDSKIKVTYVGDIGKGTLEVPMGASGKADLTGKDNIFSYSVKDTKKNGKKTIDATQGLTYDWIDALQYSPSFDGQKQALTFPVDGPFQIDPSIVDTSEALPLVGDRANFYANGLFWVFYDDDTNIVYRTSSDGTIWSSKTTVRARPYANCTFETYYDGTYVHYATSATGDADSLVYRRGTVNGDGTITWSAAEQAVGNFGDYTWVESVCVVDGEPVISLTDISGSTRYVKVTKSSTNDGTWSTEAGFPYTVDSGSDLSTWGAISEVCPLAGDDFLIVWSDVTSTNYIKCKAHDGSSWSADQTVSSAANNNTEPSLTTDTATGIAYIVWNSLTDLTKYATRAADGTISSTTQIGTTCEHAPTIEFDSASSIYVFWIANSDAVYYNHYTDSWQGEAEFLAISYSAGNISSAYRTEDGIVAIAWEDSDGDDLYHDYIEPAVSPTVATGEVSNPGSVTYTVHGSLTDDGGEPCTVYFEYDDDGAPFAYTTDEQEGKVTGNDFEEELTGLEPSTTYYYRAVAENSIDTDYGIVYSFTTEGDIGTPSSFIAIPQSPTTVSLKWTKGTGATRSLVRMKVGSYPEDETDGYQVYFDRGTSYLVQSLEPGKTYYFRVWGEDGGVYSENYLSQMATTLAGATAGSPFSPSTPARFFAAPSTDNLHGWFFYESWSQTAEDIQMPEATLFIILFLGMGAVFGVFLYLVTKQPIFFLAGVGTMMAYMWNVALLPGWVLAAYTVMGVSLWMISQKT